MRPRISKTDIIPGDEAGTAMPRISGENGRSTGPFAFRFVVNFGPQLSTPCSRSLEVGPQTVPPTLPPSPSMFHRHLRCHTFAL